MNPSKARTWKGIGVFYALTLLLSVPFWYLTTDAWGNLTLITGVMWTPALAACLTKWMYRESPRDFAWRWGEFRYRRLAYLIPLLYALPVYLVVWGSGLGGFHPAAFVHGVAGDWGLTALPAPLAWVVYVLVALSAGFIAKGGRALGEEIGWRGFLVPELAKVTGFTGVGLISGLMWALWHYPAILFAGYNEGTPAWYALTCFTVMVVASGFIAAWLRLRSGSLWPAVIYHASHNMFIQMIFTPMTGNTGSTPWLIDEFGAGLAITTVIVAFILWRKRGELNLPAAETGQGIAQPA